MEREIERCDRQLEMEWDGEKGKEGKEEGEGEIKRKGRINR